MITVTRENRVSMYLLLLAWTQSIIATMSCLMLVKEPLKAVGDHYMFFMKDCMILLGNHVCQMRIQTGPHLAHVPSEKIVCC
jgi:hypothetical protein